MLAGRRAKRPVAAPHRDRIIAADFATIAFAFLR
jgi:hypothetical protein